MQCSLASMFSQIAARTDPSMYRRRHAFASMFTSTIGACIRRTLFFTQAVTASTTAMPSALYELCRPDRPSVAASDSPLPCRRCPALSLVDHSRGCPLKSAKGSTCRLVPPAQWRRIVPHGPQDRPLCFEERAAAADHCATVVNEGDSARAHARVRRCGCASRSGRQSRESEKWKIDAASGKCRPIDLRCLGVTATRRARNRACRPRCRAPRQAGISRRQRRRLIAHAIGGLPHKGCG